MQIQNIISKTLEPLQCTIAAVQNLDTEIKEAVKIFFVNLKLSLRKILTINS